MGMPITHDSENAQFFRNQYPDHPHCARCGYPANTVVIHKVPYGFEEAGDVTREKGCFVICESCHRILGDWEERWPYYLTLMEYWKKDNIDITPDEKIDLYMNVKAGR